MSERENKPTVRILSETTLSTRGSTRATLYTMSNKILTREGRTHVAWLDHLATCRVCTLDRATGRWTEPVVLGDGTDNHCGPALTIDGEGCLHAMVGSHGVIDQDPPVPFQHRRSLRPNDSRYWTPPRLVGARPTYPSLVCDREGTLHLTYRGRPAAPTWIWNYPTPSLLYQVKRPGADWLEPAELVRSPQPYGYVFYGNGLCVDNRNRLHLVFSFYDGDPGRGHTTGYMRCEDPKAGWTKADGTPAPPPCGVHTADVLRTSDTLDMRVSNVACDGAARPHVVVLGAPQPGDAELHWHDGAGWNRRPLLEDARRAMPDCLLTHDCTVAFDRDDHLYVALQAVPPGGGWGGEGSQVVLLFSADGARTFQALRISGDEDRPNWQPSLERPSSYHQAVPDVPALLYTHGCKGASLTVEELTEVRFVLLGKA